MEKQIAEAGVTTWDTPEILNGILTETAQIAFESSVEGIAILNSNQQFIYLNKPHVELFGYQETSELLGKTWEILYEEKERETIRQKYLPELFLNGQARFFAAGIKKDGDFIYQDVRLSLLPNDQMLCMTNDLTDKRLLTIKLNQFAFISGNSHILFAQLNRATKITWANSAFLNYFDIQDSDIGNVELRQLLEVNTVDKEKLEQLFRSASKAERYRNEFLVINKNDLNERWFEISINLFNYDADQNSESIILSLYDITESKMMKMKIYKLMEEEKKLYEIRKRFIDIAIHEFKTPLATIQTSIDLIKVQSLAKESKQDSGSYSGLEKYIQKANNEIRKMNAIVENQLVIGKINNGGFVAQFIPEDLGEILEAFIKEEKVLNPDFQFKFTIKGKPVKSNTDKILFLQIIRNLLTNAYKYSGEVKKIHVHCNYHPGNVLIFIQDQGIGIEDESMPYIFEPFFRAPSVNTKDGVGLGLFIVKSLMNFHNGKITVVSEKEKGTKMILTFPVQS